MECDDEEGATEEPTDVARPTQPTPTTPYSMSCAPTKFQCPGSGECIWQMWVCDGDEDCEHGEDESDEICKVSSLTYSVLISLSNFTTNLFYRDDSLAAGASSSVKPPPTSV